MQLWFIKILFVFFSAALYGNSYAASGVDVFNDYRTGELSAEIFATMGETGVIPMSFFVRSAKKIVREKYYHRQPSERQLLTLRDELVSDLIDAGLIAEEIEARGFELGLDLDMLRLASKDEKMREQRLPMLLKVIEADRLLPLRGELRAFFDKYRAKFTQPQRQKVAMILLGVSPSASASQWDDAFELAGTLYGRLQEGEEFSRLAKEYSTHESAQKGGELGFIHQGMLIDRLQSVVDGLSVDEVSRPAWTLQGVVLFRLIERTKSRLIAFEEAKLRAKGLWLDERKKQLWQQFIVNLRERFSQKIVVNQVVFD